MKTYCNSLTPHVLTAAVVGEAVGLAVLSVGEFVGYKKEMRQRHLLDKDVETTYDK